MGKVAIVGYGSNLDSFPTYRCKYEVTAAEADSFEDAKEGKWRSPVRSRNRLVVDENSVLFECGAQSANVAMRSREVAEEIHRKGSATVTVTFMPEGFLTNGHRTLHHTPDFTSANLFDETFPAPMPSQTPLGYCGYRHGRAHAGPDTYLSRPEIYAAAFQGVREYQGRPVFHAFCQAWDQRGSSVRSRPKSRLSACPSAT